jgi:transposase-like protein
MKRKVKRIPDELALKAAQEFLDTTITIKELQSKYGFKGVSTLYNWIRKFGLSYPSGEEIKINEAMEKEKRKSSREQELEKKIAELEKQLNYERLRAKAYNKMIEIAEREYSISIKKKHGFKR